MRPKSFSGLAGAISRTATAPIDRLKMILQVQEDARGMSLREGLSRIASEGDSPVDIDVLSSACSLNVQDSCKAVHFAAQSGSVCAYFRGNGANVFKIAPETALKLTLNDKLKHAVARDPEHIQPLERFLFGGMSGAVAQVSISYPCCNPTFVATDSLEPNNAGSSLSCGD
jgi:solute carrier family 25 phosphate transporter 23/24/25/41